MTIATPRDWRSGESMTAALLNQEIRDQFADLIAAWTSYTPTWSSSGTQPAILNGTLVGRYKLVGKTCTVTLKLTAGSTTTYGTGQYNFSLPFTPVTGFDFIGNVFIGDSSVGAGGYTTTGIAFVTSASAQVACYTGNTGAGTVMGALSPQTFANGDRIWITVTYETA